ncbi:hypothetical protein BDR04DRAFT_1095832 [Suillus decipiens]|nr:hypothetical protein BDR04DRAFT_1095832 [Suillus decipiens]
MSSFLFPEPIQTYPGPTCEMKKMKMRMSRCIHSADSDSGNGSGSVQSLDLPLQAHMLSGRGRRLSAVVPVLLAADFRNIVPLLCSTFYQRHVWRIRQPVVGLCCSSSDTITTAIFGWLDSDRSEEGRVPVAHLALAADVGLHASMGVFYFTDTHSAISLAQFVLGLWTHFEDIRCHIDGSSRFSDSVVLEI